MRHACIFVMCIKDHYVHAWLCTGKWSKRWNAATIRLALAVYCCSPAAYDALKSFGLQLSSRSTLQVYTGAFLEDCGNTYTIHV